MPIEKLPDYRAAYYRKLKRRYKYKVLPIEHAMYDEIRQAAKRQHWSIAETMRTFLQWGLDTVE